jgi:hypothetical protein
MWEPRRLTNLRDSTACYRDSFTFLFSLLCKLLTSIHRFSRGQMWPYCTKGVNCRVKLQRAMYFMSEALKPLATATKQLSLLEKLRDGQSSRHPSVWHCLLERGCSLDISKFNPALASEGTEQVSTAVTLWTYSRCAWFVTRPGHRISWSFA